MTTSQITGYKNLKPLNAQGGMGDILVGYDEKTNAKIVVKLLRLPFGEHKAHRARNSFFMEQEIATSVNHPHILQAITHGEVLYHGENRPYLVYPYIETGSLQKLMETDQPWRNPSWSLSQIADIIVQAAEGLSHLHMRYNIVHRDVKPENFLWEHERQVSHRRVHIWVSDLGIARLAKDTSHKTLIMAGTPGYIAPEQTDGYISASIDQYALAIVTRYLFTGFSPKERDKRTPLTQLNPQRLRSQEIDHVVLKALSPNPEERFPSIIDFAQALKKAVEQQENPDRFLISPASIQLQEAHNFYSSPTKPSPIAPQQPLSEQQSVNLPSVAPKVDGLFPDIALQRFDEYTPVNKSLPNHSSTQFSSDQASGSLPSLTSQQPVKVHLPVAPYMLSWSPDGSTLVCSFRLHAPLLVYEHMKIQTLPIAPGHLVCWKPDGNSLAVSAGNSVSNGVRLWNISTSTEQPLSLFPNNTTSHIINDLDWSSREQLALWIDKHIRIYHVSSAIATSPIRRETALPDMKWGNQGTLHWSPDGSMLAVGSLDGALFC